jgi:PAS domain S-box-containing protein
VGPPEFIDVLGLSDEQQQASRDDVLRIIHPEDVEKVRAVPQACTPEEPTYRMQYRALRPDGSIVWLEASGRAFFDQSGTMQRTIGMVADITDHKRAEEAISALTRRLIDAQENERARIARDLHDDIGQRLALALVTLEQQKPAEVKKELRKQLEDIAKSVHSLSHELHAATLRYLGIAKAMRGFCIELAEQKQVDIAFSHRNVPRAVPREVSLCLFRVLQEALHNAVRYSKVSRFEVELLGSPDAVSLIVRDGGIGFDPDKAVKGRGLGLVSMQERLKLVNGRLSINSQHARGTAIHARVPLADQTPASVVV